MATALAVQIESPDTSLSLSPLASRRAEYLRLVVRGWSYREVADKFQVDPQVVYQGVYAELGALDHARRRQAERVVDLMLGRLDICTKAAVAILEGEGPGGRKGGEGGLDRVTTSADIIAAIHALVRVDERRANLLGANAPIRYEHSGSVGLSLEPEQVRRLSTAELEALQSAYGKLLEAEPETVAGEVVSSVAVGEQAPIKRKSRKQKA